MPRTGEPAAGIPSGSLHPSEREYIASGLGVDGDEDFGESARAGAGGPAQTRARVPAQWSKETGGGIGMAMPGGRVNNRYAGLIT